MGPLQSRRNRPCHAVLSVSHVHLTQSAFLFKRPRMQRQIKCHSRSYLSGLLRRIFIWMSRYNIFVLDMCASSGVYLGWRLDGEVTRHGNGVLLGEPIKYSYSYLPKIAMNDALNDPSKRRLLLFSTTILGIEKAANTYEIKIRYTLSNIHIRISINLLLIFCKTLDETVPCLLSILRNR